MTVERRTDVVREVAFEYNLDAFHAHRISQSTPVSLKYCTQSPSAPNLRSTEESVLASCALILFNVHIVSKVSLAPCSSPQGSTSHRSRNLFATQCCLSTRVVSAPAMNVGHVVAVNSALLMSMQEMLSNTSITSASKSHEGLVVGYSEISRRDR
jgi:hypothetical protein